MRITLSKKQFREFMQDISKFHNATTRCGYPLERNREGNIEP